MKHQYIKNVVTLQFDADKCTGCGMCAKVCPHGVFKLKERKAFIADRNACMECGACAMNCPFSAISVRPGVGCAAGLLLSKLTGSGECTCG